MSKSSNHGDGGGVLRIPPYSYIHILDTNTNVTDIETGPKTFIRHAHQRIVAGPTQMVRVPPRHYCIIKNPAVINAEGVVEKDEFGMTKLRFSERECRVSVATPFPLYPGEELEQAVTPLTVVDANKALKIRCVLDHLDPNTQEKRECGEEYLFKGPATYIPSVDSEVVDTIDAVVVKPDSALKLRALRDCVDSDGEARVTGEEWVYDTVGAYIPGVYEEIVEVITAHVLTEKVALHLVARRNFTDARGVERLTGDQWLVTVTDTNVHVPHIYENVRGIVRATTLSSSQHAYILNPVDPETGKNQRGARKLVRGECTFFLKPGERLDGNGIKNNYVLGADEGLLLHASQQIDTHSPGTKWMIRGPCEYVPPVEVEVLEERKSIVLDSNEGVYVRDTHTGTVRAVIGETYMLNENEVLWEKQLEPAVEKIINSNRDPVADRGRKHNKHQDSESTVRDKTRVVSYRVPHNSVTQIYDFKQRKARIVFGPELVMLGPDEQFTQVSLSGSKPKRPNEIRTLVLLLGPDFMTDIIQVETMDHARLQIQLSYNWFFNVNGLEVKDAGRLFSVPDFVGDACKAIASNVRGAVASVSFNDFHKSSKDIIRQAVFGYTVDADGNHVANETDLVFPANRLHITSVDIQSVEPVDQGTRDNLQKSVQLAIEITTQSQEATAKHEAQRQEQAARGRLERQKITDEAEAESDRKRLLELQAESSAVESQGQAKAEANSRAEAALIEAKAELEQVRIKSEAQRIEADAELKRVQAAREAELVYVRETNKLEIERQNMLSTIETKKFSDMVSAIGQQTLVAMARAGPDAQAKLLGGLGIQSTIITDGSTPLNLFNTAKGLIGSNATPGA